MIRFVSNIVVEGVPYASGDTVPEADLPAGNLVSMLRLGQVERVTDSPAAPLPAGDPPAPQSAAKKASK